MPFKNWKECAWKNLNDGKDNGLIKASVFQHVHKLLKKLKGQNMPYSKEKIIIG